MSYSKKYRLTYFDGRGIAEPARFMFAQAGVDYDDVRFKFGDPQWTAMKPDAPYGLPTLHVDGEMYCQSYAITAFLAREFGLCGKDSKEQLRVDMINFCMQDLVQKIPFQEKDEKKKAEILKEHYGTTLPPRLAKLESILKEQDGGDKYFASRVTHADLGWSITVDVLNHFGPNCITEKTYPKLYALSERVKNLPKIKAWIEKRPKTEF